MRAERVRPIVKFLNSSSILRALLLLCIFSAHLSAATAKMPNILVIVADDLGYADLGVHGGKDGRVSNKQRLHDVNFAAKTKRRGAGMHRRVSVVDTHDHANRLHCHGPPAVGTA